MFDRLRNGTEKQVLTLWVRVLAILRYQNIELDFAQNSIHV